jgi:dTDP-4-amino-4,6-dideoxygalactose transaminase
MSEGYRILRCDLRPQAEELLPQLLQAAERVLRSGRYILGAELEAFEREFAEFLGVRYAVGVASGTEALFLALRAVGIGHGDEVIAPAFTAIPTVAAILMSGARPVLVDIDPQTYTLDPALVAAALSERTRAIVVVHLFGQSAEMEPLLRLATDAGVVLIEDAAQAHGSKHHGWMLGTFGRMGCFSFYPTKNLGAYGDAGMVVTDDAELAERLRLLRNYGQVSPYRSVLCGINSRLDELQAAFLRVKLPYLMGWNQRRARLAQLYQELLQIPQIRHPVVRPYNEVNWHVYVVRAEQRDRLWEYLEAHGIQANVYYPVPIHLQEAYRFLGYREGDFPHSEAAAQEVLALPMFPELEEAQVEMVAAAIRRFYGYA